MSKLFIKNHYTFSIILHKEHAILFIILISIFWQTNAKCMQYSETNPASETSDISATGLIQRGDDLKFYNYISSNFRERHRNLRAIWLSSDGGDLAAAQSIAKIVERTGVAVIVDKNSFCNSACFLIFAASRHRFVGAGAKFGVHSVSNSDLGQTIETFSTFGDTVALARIYHLYGVPENIIGKMVITVYPNMYYLDDKDIKSMATYLDEIH